MSHPMSAQRQAERAQKFRHIIDVMYPEFQEETGKDLATIFLATLYDPFLDRFVSLSAAGPLPSRDITMSNAASREEAEHDLELLVRYLQDIRSPLAVLDLDAGEWWTYDIHLAVRSHHTLEPANGQGT